MSGRIETARRRTTSRRHLRIVGLLTASLVLFPAAVSAQSDETCATLRTRIDAFAQGGGAGQAALAIRQNQAELDRVRSYSDDSGCNGDSVFDDPDSPECHTLLRRAEELRRTIARLSAEAGQGSSDEERRAAIEDYNASCSNGGTDAALPTPDTLVPVDPDAPPGPAAAPARADRVARVLCVRHCDGAYYPLAVDVPTDKLEGMDQLCQAQCPEAQSSLYTDPDGDVAKAQALDGTSYSALPTAFRFEKDTSPTCACRAPGESWAQTLAKAQAMIETHKGDVVVTPEIQARMALPELAAAPEAKPTKPSHGRAPSKRARSAPPQAPPALDAETANPGEDLTRAFRRSVPTL